MSGMRCASTRATSIRAIGKSERRRNQAESFISINESSPLSFQKNSSQGGSRGGLHRWPRSLAIALFLAGVGGAVAGPGCPGAVTIPYDAKALFQAELQFLANAIHQGQSPFWSPNVFGGMPQIADPQSLIFSPMVLLALLAPHPSFHALDVAVLALLALAGLAVLMYFRDRGWHPAGGIVAALAFAFGASAAWRIQHIGQIESFVFFAIALWLLARALDRSSLLYGLARRHRGRTDAGAAGSGRVSRRAVPRSVTSPTTGWRSRRAVDGAAPLALQAARGRGASRPAHHRGAGPAHAAVRRVERPRGVPLRGGDARLAASGLAAHHAGRRICSAPIYAVPYWGPYSVAWDPKHLFLSPNMGQLYAGALPMLAILVFGLARGARLDARDPLLLARARSC